MNKLLKINDLSKLLNISRSKAYSLSNEKDFPIIKLGKCKRIFEADLIVWLNKHKNVL